MNSFSQKNSDWLRQISVSLKSSWISLLIIVLVILLSRLQQSDTIIIDLLDRNAGNFFLFVLLVLFLSQIVAHYPTYLEINQAKLTPDAIKWKIEQVILGLGFITYHGDLPNKSGLILHLRNLWGLFLLSAVFYLLLVAHSRNIELYAYSEKSVINWNWIQVILYALVCLVSYGGISRYFTDKPSIYRKILINTTLGIFLMTLSMALIYSGLRGWSQGTYWWTYTLLCVSPPFYSAVRLFRENTRLKNHVIFLKFIAVGGFLSVFILWLAHIYIFKINPLVILLAQFIVLYGIAVIPVKHYFYYRQGAVAARLGFWKRAVFLWLFRLHILLIIIASTIAGFIGNDLHLLPTLPEQQAETIGFDEFVKDFDARFTPNDTVYFIASFGGGLKANIWNQLILNSLANYKGHAILSHTVAMSGVSGGTIGHAVFSGLYNKHPGTDSSTLKIRKSEIEKLGWKNFVSLDLTYLLGRDLFFEFVPGFLYREMGQINDRAKRAMQEYSDFVNGDSTMLSHSFRSFWASLYRKERAEGRFFPALIANGAGTHIQRGIACSVNMQGALFDTTFFDSSDLLSFQGDSASLSFLYAASCTNRFPLFSPAAKINEKGHFIDGGYFENSGMLSLLDFFEALKSKSECFKRGANDSSRKEPTVIFIQIANSEEEYLKSLLRGKQFRKEVSESSEFGSIVGTVTSISFVPSYLMKKSENKPNYVQIHLPYYVRYKDVEKQFKAKEIIYTKACSSAIDTNNRRIQLMVQSNPYDFVQPPLARLLGKQSVRYMNAALDRKETWAELDSVLKK